MLRLIMALGVAFMLLPQDNNLSIQGNAHIADTSGYPHDDTLQVNSMETLSAAQAVYYDLSNFCDRNQEACLTGTAILNTLEQKARTGLREFSGYIHEKSSNQIDPSATGSIR